MAMGGTSGAGAGAGGPRTPRNYSSGIKLAQSPRSKGLSKRSGKPPGGKAGIFGSPMPRGAAKGPRLGLSK